ncbi:hypothetical protein [Bradyrhizobium forestalis]|nr:hypothetical protein [Bradyrhizobium forestalis]
MSQVGCAALRYVLQEAADQVASSSVQITVQTTPRGRKSTVASPPS